MDAAATGPRRFVWQEENRKLVPVLVFWVLTYLSTCAKICL